MAKITYNNKVVRTNTPPTVEEQFSADDANELKASLNYLYDNPIVPDLTGYIQNKLYTDTPQDASVNVSGSVGVAGESPFSGEQASSNLFAGALMIQDGASSINIFAGGISSSTANSNFSLSNGLSSTNTQGNVILSPNVVNGFNPSTGNYYTVTPSALALVYSGFSRAIQVKTGSTVSTVVNYFPERNGVLATLDDVPKNVITNYGSVPIVISGATNNSTLSATGVFFNGEQGSFGLSASSNFAYTSSGMFQLSPNFVQFDNYNGSSVFVNAWGASGGNTSADSYYSLTPSGIEVKDGGITRKILVDVDSNQTNITNQFPNRVGRLAVLEDVESLGYLTSPDGSKWYIQNDGTFSLTNQ